MVSFSLRQRIFLPPPTGPSPVSFHLSQFEPMKPWIFGLLVCIATPIVTGAEQFFERAGVTKTINAVSVLPRNTKAVPGDVITKDLALKTGGIHAPSWSSPTSRSRVWAPTRSFVLSQVKDESSLMMASCCFTRRKVSGGAQLRRAPSLRRRRNGLHDFEHQGKSKSNLPRRDGSRLFHGKTQDPHWT